MVLRRDLGAPAVLDHDGLVRLDDDGGAVDLVAGRKLLAGVDRGLVPLAVGEELVVRAGEGSLARVVLCFALAEFGAAADRLDRHRLDHQLLGAVDEAEPRLVRLLEGGLHFGERAGLDHQRGVGAGVADMGADDHLDLAGRHALARDLGLGVLAEPAALALERGQRLRAEALLDRLLARGADVGEAHAVGRQQRRERVDQHLGHAERVGDQAGVLAAGAAEAVERIAGDVVAALHGDLLDRIGHVLDRDLDEAVGDLFRRFAADLFRQLRERLLHRVGVERLVLLGPENLREEIGDELADQHVGVGDRERPAAAVAFRAGIGAGASRGRRGSARRRNAGSSRRRPRPYG